jgi:thioredoxin reductase (NADPH)
MEESLNNHLMAEDYDLIVVGSGPAGLSGAIFAAQRGLKVLIFESGSVGGAMSSIYPNKIIPNYPGYSNKITGRELANLFVEEAKGLGVEIRNERVLEISVNKIVKTGDGEYEAKAVLIATGSRPRELGIPGEADYNYADRGVYYFSKELEKFRDKRVLIVGGGDSAVDAALELVEVAAKVVLIHRRGNFRAVDKNVQKLKKTDVEIRMNTELREIKGDDERVRKVVIFNNSSNDRWELEIDSVILAVGMTPNTEIFQKLGLDLDSEGRIVVDSGQRTNIEGIYAAGDIVSGTGKLELIVVAVAQGAIAAHNIYMDIYQPYWME